MKESDLHALLVAEFGASWQDQTVNGLLLADAIAAPKEVLAQDTFQDGKAVHIWLLARDRSPAEEGLFVGFSSQRQEFCLAEFSPKGAPYILGFHATFRDAIEAM